MRPEALVFISEEYGLVSQCVAGGIDPAPVRDLPARLLRTAQMPKDRDARRTQSDCIREFAGCLVEQRLRPQEVLSPRGESCQLETRHRPKGHALLGLVEWRSRLVIRAFS